MAHTCPDCGQMCYCNGDVDDIDWGEASPEANACTHFKQCEEEYDNGEEDDFNPEDWPDDGF